MNHAEFAIQSDSVNTPDRQHQLVREKTLFLYSQALERGDLDLVGTILRQAETDEVLENMVFDLTKSIEAEYFGPQAASYSTTPGALGWILDASLSAARALEPVEEELVPMIGQRANDDGQPVSEIEDRADELFRLALDCVNDLQYLEAEQYLSQALDLALFVDDPLAIAECAFLFADIEKEMSDDACAQAFCRLGLSILDAALPSAARQGQQYACGAQSPLMSLG